LKEHVKDKYLINSWFYNSNDLDILMTDNKSTTLTIISYCKDGIYTHFSSTAEQVDDPDFKNVFINFHKKHRIQYVFMNNRVHDTKINKKVDDEVKKSTKFSAYILNQHLTCQYSW